MYFGGAFTATQTLPDNAKWRTWRLWTEARSRSRTRRRWKATKYPLPKRRSAMCTTSACSGSLFSPCTSFAPTGVDGTTTAARRHAARRRHRRRTRLAPGAMIAISRRRNVRTAASHSGRVEACSRAGASAQHDKRWRAAWQERHHRGCDTCGAERAS